MNIRYIMESGQVVNIKKLYEDEQAELFEMNYKGGEKYKVITQREVPRCFISPNGALLGLEGNEELEEDFNNAFLWLGVMAEQGGA